MADCAHAHALVIEFFVAWHAPRRSLYSVNLRLLKVTDIRTAFDVTVIGAVMHKKIKHVVRPMHINSQQSIHI